MVQVVYLVAGMSSRFQGKVKQLVKVGPNEETLIEVSLLQALKAGIKEVIFIVGDKTLGPFKEKFGPSYKGMEIKYALQTFDPKKRDKPQGTCDAVCCAKDLIKDKFIVCGGDDLYGESSFSKILEHFSISNENAAVAWKLKDVIPEIGEVSRGIIKEKKGYVTGLDEIKNISKENLPEGISSTSLCSMLFFGLTKDTLLLLEKRLLDFKKKDVSRDSEVYLPVEISNLIKEKKTKMKVYISEEPWMGVTNPGDEISIKEFLSNPVHSKSIAHQNLQGNIL